MPILKRNGHQPLGYAGPAKPIPTRSWRGQLADILSASLVPAVLALAVLVVLMDVFIWRP